MTVRARLGQVRRVVGVALAMKIASLSVAVLACGLVVTLALDALLVLHRGVRFALLSASLGLGVVTGGILVRRARRSWSDQSLALWIEQRVPLDYLLVTASDGRFENDGAITTQLEQRAFERPAKAAAWQGARAPTAAAALLLAGVLLVPTARLERVVRPRPGDVLNVAATDPSSRLTPLVARYTRPGYAGGNVTVIEDPISVRGLEGGTVELLGRGAAEGISASAAGRVTAAVTEERGWRVTLPMPATAGVVRISAGAEERLLSLEPIRDSLPQVALRTPARDTVVREARGRLALEAVVTDDISLATGWFELIVSSGSGELFQFRSGVLARRPLRGRADTLDATLSLDSLDLQPGDILHVRAVAADAGPAARGTGSSDTRTLRVARASESDTSAVIALPPLPSDTSALSQRMLIQLTEALQARRTRIAHQVLLDESRAISRDEARLRREIADLVFMRLSGEAAGEERSGGDTAGALTPEELLAAAEAATALGGDQPLDFAEDESPVVAVNRPLLEAYNAMWDATRELDVGEPGKALPPMRVALEAIQRARAAERIYLRGRAPKVVVNVPQVRLSGKQEGVVLGQRVPEVPAGASPLERLLAGAALVDDDPGAARDLLLLLRVDLLDQAPAAAASLGQAIAALRGGSDPRPALARTRALLGGAATRADAGAWAAGSGW